jgi:hypothetical protein
MIAVAATYVLTIRQGETLCLREHDPTFDSMAQASVNVRGLHDASYTVVASEASPSNY